MRRSEELAKAGRRFEQPSEALLKARFSRVAQAGSAASARLSQSLAPAEKRLVVELGESAQILAETLPGRCRGDACAGLGPRA